MVFRAHLSTALITGTLMAASNTTLAENDAPHWTLTGFEQPESVVGDQTYLYVSNINGTPMEKNGKGYISKITADGKWIEQHWAMGLDAPKGMAIHDGFLYVADLTRLHKIDLNSGQTQQVWEVSDAKMLNDVTVSPEGVVYVSDLIGGGLYRLKGNTFALWKTYPELEHPNGVLWEDNTLIVGNWGQGMHEDFSTDSPGILYRIALESEALSPLLNGEPLGNIDGITRIDETLWISDWLAGDLMKADGSAKRHLGQGLADIYAIDNTLYTPMMMDGTVSAWHP
jgi:sugar lactone lactonase YvrE